MKNKHIKSIFTQSDCIDRGLLLKYKDKALSDQEMFEVEKHLVDCDLCSEALEGLALMASTTALHDVDKRLNDLLYRNTDTGTPRTHRYWLVAASVAILFISGFIVWMVSPTDPSAQLAQHVEPTKTQPAVEDVTSANAAPQESEPVLAEQKEIKANKSDEIENSPPARELAANAPAAKQPAMVESAQQSDDYIAMQGSASEAEATFASPAFDVKNLDEVYVSQPLSKVSNNTKAETRAVTPAATRASTSEETTKEKASSISKDEARFNVTYVSGLKAIDYAPLFDDQTKNLVVPRTHTDAALEVKKAKAEVPNENLANPSYLQRLAPVLSLMSKEKYTEAIPLLTSLRTQQPLDLNVRFYLGLSYHKAEQYNKSNSELAASATGKPDTFIEESKWYMALNFIALNEKAKAEKLLNAIVKQNGFYKTRAQAQLEKIKQ